MFKSNRLALVAATLLSLSMICAVVQADEPHKPNTTWTDPSGKIHVYGADGTEPWYVQAEKPKTLQAALVAEKGFLGADNVGYRMKGSRQVCTALRRVKLSCDYNTRITLSMFLTVNGKGLFPASGGTNPYYTKYGPSDSYPDDGFVGQSIQNNMLATAVRRNVKLFHNGDLTAEAVRNSWK